MQYFSVSVSVMLSQFHHPSVPMSVMRVQLRKYSVQMPAIVLQGRSSIPLSVTLFIVRLLQCCYCFARTYYFCSSVCYSFVSAYVFCSI